MAGHSGASTSSALSAFRAGRSSLPPEATGQQPQSATSARALPNGPSSSRLVTSVLAARGASSAVLAFKAAVDELSRLATARAQDEALLQQLQHQLIELEPAVGARLLTECRFRDEWRDEQSARALSSLPSAEQDPEVVARMQEYVALLAPDEPEPPRSKHTTLAPHPDACDADGGGTNEWSWQRELLRQQRALASLLSLCSEHASSDRVAGVLSDFMDHSRARLHEQLLTVHEHLVELAMMPADERAALAAASKRQAAQASQQPAPRHSPRNAWGDPIDEKSGLGQVGSAQPASGFRGLNADEFVEQLRGKHRAVCTLQAGARGRIQRIRFQRLMHQRLGATVRLQCAARQACARRTIKAVRHAQWLEACDALLRLHSARRVQRAWRWVRRKRLWRSIWLAAVAKRAKKEDKRWRGALRASLLPRAPESTGFSQYAVYTESKVLTAKRQEEECGAARLQSLARALRDRKQLAREVAAATVLQSGMRRWRVRAVVCRWRRALRRLHDARRAKLRWRTARATALALQPLQTQAVLVHLHVQKELGRVTSEAAREKTDFEIAFKKWSAKMERQMLAKKLHADWIPQMNVEKGESYYFNVRTGESSDEHPNMRQVRATERKQRAAGEAQVAERLGRLRDYESLLREGEEARLAEYVEQASKVVADATALRQPAAAARWVQH